MGQPDFKAFDQYANTDWDPESLVRKIPVTNPEVPGASYILINASLVTKDATGAPRLLEDQDAQVQDAREALLGQILQTKPTNQYGDQDVIQQLIQMFGEKYNAFQIIKDDVINEAGLLNAGGGFSYGNIRSVIYDPTKSNLEDTVERAIGKQVVISAQDEKYFDEYVMNHEAAHNMLGLNEAGADFMAAAILLRKDRGADTMLGIAADARNVAWHRDMYKEDASQLGTEHNSECSNAIQYARAMNPDELKNMSMEDLYAIAKRFDDIANFNLYRPDMRPEAIVMHAVESPLPGEPTQKSITLNSGRTAIVSVDAVPITPQSLQDRLPKIELPEGSEEDKLRDRMTTSFNNLNALPSPPPAESPEAETEKPRTPRPSYTVTPVF